MQSARKIDRRREPKTFRLHPDDARALRKAVAQADRGEFLPVSRDELYHYLATGELPEHARRWLDSYK